MRSDEGKEVLVGFVSLDSGEVATENQESVGRERHQVVPIPSDLLDRIAILRHKAAEAKRNSKILKSSIKSIK